MAVWLNKTKGNKIMLIGIISLVVGFFTGSMVEKNSSYCECFREDFKSSYCESIKGDASQGSCSK